MTRHAAIRSSALGIVIALMLALMAAPAEASPALRVHPHFGPAGTAVHLHGSGFGPQNSCHAVNVIFIDSAEVTLGMGTARLRGDGTFGLETEIPAQAALGKGTVIARTFARNLLGFCALIGPTAAHVFKVTP